MTNRAPPGQNERLPAVPALLCAVVDVAPPPMLPTVAAAPTAVSTRRRLKPSALGACEPLAKFILQPLNASVMDFRSGRV
jgi:hypothetical protein